MDRLTKDFLTAWNSGQVCIHPTDTLPGLSFNPLLPSSKKLLFKIKQRESSKPPVSLIGSLDKALIFWQPLSSLWLQLLKAVWPGPVTIIAKASDQAPTALVSDDGFLALRLPNLSNNKSWLKEVLEAIETPFPTTSVNISGFPPCTTWQDATETFQKNEVYIPQWQTTDSQFLDLPSTIVKIENDHSYKIIRSGALAEQDFINLWQSAKSISNSKTKG